MKTAILIMLSANLLINLWINYYIWSNLDFRRIIKLIFLTFKNMTFY